MKKYIAPELEIINYEVEDCLEGSKGIGTEAEDLGPILDDLF